MKGAEVRTTDAGACRVGCHILMDVSVNVVCLSRQPSTEAVCRILRACQPVELHGACSPTATAALRKTGTMTVTKRMSAVHSRWYRLPRKEPCALHPVGV